MMLPQIMEILDEAQKIGSIEWIFFEGGEPFLFYPLLCEGIKLAKEKGFSTGIVTNAYWATSVERAERKLKPLFDLGLDSLSISDDSFHAQIKETNPAENAINAAKKLGIPSSTICIEKPFVETKPNQEHGKGTSVIGGGAMFKGRAVETLTSGLPNRDWRELNKCLYEDFKSPSRVHVDAYGHVHLCQGISLGNMLEKPLSELIREYNVESHPICEPLHYGGPAELAKRYNINHNDQYVDECHFCYRLRQSLTEEFPLHLAPKHVYGLSKKIK